MPAPSLFGTGTAASPSPFGAATSTPGTLSRFATPLTGQPAGAGILGAVPGAATPSLLSTPFPSMGQMPQQTAGALGTTPGYPGMAAPQANFTGETKFKDLPEQVRQVSALPHCACAVLSPRTIETG